MSRSTKKCLPLAAVPLALILVGAACSTVQNKAQKEKHEEWVESRAPASGTLLSQSQFFEYDVRFTNPECVEYKYAQPVETVSGGSVSARPKNVFCSSRDSKPSGARPEAPQFKIIEWANDSETTEIFFTFLSFSNSAVKNALCEAANRGVKIQFIIDTTSDTTKAEELAACGTGPGGVKPKYVQRGHTDGIGYAHNKIFIVNPSSKDKIRIAFGSGNMTSGVVLHHENWHFITTHVNTYFAQSHLCAMKGTWDEKIDASAVSYGKFMRDCRLQTGLKEEDDIRAFFIPGDTDKANRALIDGIGGNPGIARSREIWIAAHRFSYSRMLSALKTRINQGNVDIRVVADDDMYWVGTAGQQLGDNGAEEYSKLQDLVKRGARSKFMETNDSEHLLHHNKYLIFDDRAVFGGAGNLTGAAFNTNHENFYYIMIPEVVTKFRQQYQHVWDDLATAPKDMPKEHTIPPMPIP